MPSLNIDGREINVPEGTTVIQAAEQLGIFIPRYCYHPGLSIAGNCRICLVDVERSPKLEIACNLTVRDGMVVHTESAKAEDGRRSVLEFLLANHPLDCPVCDQSGECDLQNFYMNFGLYDPRFREQKVKKKKAVELGPHVMLDQERCILCSRCVRFTDEITKTGEFGIFNRGDGAELSIYPGEVLDNPYSANVVDICPVGALTEKDFRFTARVWYLSSAPSVCNGCSQGCNIDLHFVLDRPHLNGGARLVRIKPRYNPEVNHWWMCDEGRYGFGWVDRGRITKVQQKGDTDATWERALTAIAAGLTRARESGIGVIASAQLTNEDLFLIREIFQHSLGARVTASVRETPGSSDDFLIQSDKNPNTHGAMLLGLVDPEAADAERILDDAVAGKLGALWVFGHDLVRLFGEERLRELSEKVELFVFSGTNENPTVPFAHWVLPTAAYMEKDGTFVNRCGRVQRIGRAFAPFGDAREDWRVLLDLAERLGQSLGLRGPQSIFDALAEASEPFAGMSYGTLGAPGADVAKTATAARTSEP
ncbi:MAG TPA: molybdopterin-dependent oxidoreductase [Vicinamibacteria bacterium]|nr:molybdopterin-dependent oxidoreductase [Vicinamibacteria bacterium]